MADEPTDLAARRWDLKPYASDHSPADALRAALREIDAGRDFHHLIIIGLTHDNGEVGETIVYQAGKAGLIGKLGMCARASQIIGMP